MKRLLSICLTLVCSICPVLTYAEDDAAEKLAVEQLVKELSLATG